MYNVIKQIEMKQIMITKLENESNKQYCAMCDYWQIGPGRSVTQLKKLYTGQENPPSKSYTTLSNWHKKFQWEKRISAYLVAQQKLLEDVYEEKRIEWTLKQFNLLADLYDTIKLSEVDTEATSLAQYTGAIKTVLSEVRNIFDLLPVQKIAPTSPDGKSEYQGNMVNELLELADAAKRRPK